LSYFGREPDGSCERIEGQAILKAALVAEEPAVVRLDLGLERGIALVSGDTRNLDAALRMARRMLGLAVAPSRLATMARRDPVVRRLIAGRRDLRVPLAATPFEALVWAILGQQINLAFASILRGRLIEACGHPHPSGMIAHPTPADVARLRHADLVALRCSGAKARYLLGAAEAVASGALPLDDLAQMSQHEAEERLLAQPGIGPWTANYVLLRGLGFADCVPIGDSGLAAALQWFYALDHRPGPAETLALMETFAPYRSAATCHLWASLGESAG
jgi:3-methyladenine DNA glycosylase/8-oxoguanine DNA glycosylase